jgi:hypothetical protein
VKRARPTATITMKTSGITSHSHQRLFVPRYESEFR